MRKVRVVLFGVGALGSLVGKFLLEKEGVEMVGAVDVAAGKVGKDLGEVLGLERKVGVKVSESLDDVFSSVKPDIAIHATSSFLKDVHRQLVTLIGHGVNVISTCEELANPYYTDPVMAREIDALAKENGVTVLGTGVNPGFLMDTLVLTLTAVCQKIERIEAFRVLNAAYRRLPFQKKIGAGLTLEEFRKKIENGEITGHVGLEQSIALIADALAWKLDRIIAEPVEPVIAQKPVESEHVKVEAGMVAGLRQRAKGIINKDEVIILNFQAYIGAEEEFDAITIHGVPEIRQKIQPCVHGDTATVAIVVNLIPKVIEARPGLLTMKDLPLPLASVEDLRKYFSESCVEALKKGKRFKPSN
ncbi:MAG: hypothetical protein QXD45_03975 [Candidatus Bathyarchaeia archaeon]